MLSMARLGQSRSYVMKKILLCTDGSAYSQVSYEYAAWLTQGIDMEIEILYVTDSLGEQATQTIDFSGNIGNHETVTKVW